MPPAINHLIIVTCGIIGLLLGGILIDLDHKGTWQCKWRNFWKYDKNCKLEIGIFHAHPTFMFALILFSICFGLSLAVHYVIDMMRFLK